MNTVHALVLYVAAALVTAGAAVAQQAADDAKPYTVECGPDADEGGATVCRVDRATCVGWRTFHKASFKFAEYV